MKVACVQIRAYDIERSEAALQHALDMLDEAAHFRPDLIILPECSYPAYFLRSVKEYARAARPWQEIAALFGSKAKQHRCHIVAGLVQPQSTSDALLNAAVLFGPDGEVIGSTAKSFLWHFDRRWFRAGTEYPVFDTAIGRLGMMICADGRMPEIARIMALRGAQVIVDPTALVTGGGDRARLSNPQVEYMLRVRAIENGVWIVAAAKVGLEAGSIHYSGRSCVIAPDGNKLVEGSTDREEIVTCDIDLVGAPAIPVRRQPKAYAAIAQPTESQPISRLLREPVVPEQSVFRVATLQLDESPNLEAFAGAVHGFLDTLVRQDVQLVILPGVLSEDAVLDAANAGEAAERLRAASAQFGCGLAAALTEYEGARRCRTCFLWDRGDLIGKYRKTHVGGEPYVAGSHLPVFETRFGRLGMMLDDEGLVPEVPRCLMLEGADVILWPARHSAWPLREFARARADENKVYVVLAAPTGGGTAIVNPSGALLAAALPDVEQAVGAQMVWATSHYKEMAPGTHVVWGRLPETYADLTE